MKEAANSVQPVGATKPLAVVAEKSSTPKVVTETQPSKPVIRKDAATKKTSVSSVDSNAIQKTIDRVWKQIDTGARPPPLSTSIRGSAPQRIVRIFVSSTFVDMHSEREVLVKRVFPALRQVCEPHGITVTEVDLRWGVPTDMQGTDTIRICMNELDTCCEQQKDAQPYFVSLLGSRYDVH